MAEVLPGDIPLGAFIACPHRTARRAVPAISSFVRMRSIIFTTCGSVAVLLLPSCSCAIRSESWTPVGGCDRSAVERSAIAVGFRSDGDRLKKKDSYLQIVADAERIDLQSSWCPFPHRLFFMKTSIQNWEQRTDTIRDEFLKENRQRGIRLRNVQP